VFPSVGVCYYRYLAFQPMGQKRTAEQYFETAEANGWVDGDHEEEDCVVLEQDDSSDRYKLN
jgi:hypothetical protein